MIDYETGDRMMDLSIEEMSLSGWPALQTEVYDGWILRFAEGWTKRANSVNALYESKKPVAEKIETCERAYSLRGLPTIFKILGFEGHAELDSILSDRGYARIDETRVMTLDLGSLAAANESFRHDGAIGLADGFDEAWIDAFCACSRCEERRTTIGKILANVRGDTVAARAERAGETCGFGYGAIDRGWVGLFDIVVRADARKSGFGERIVRGILESARAKGAKRAYLQVVSGNAPAERLYEKLGFRESYRYWYRRKG